MISAEGDSLELVLFRAGGHGFGLESSQVRGSGMPSVPDIPTAEALLELDGNTTGSRRTCLAIKGADQDYELSVAEPFELCTLPAEAIHPLPVALAARCRLPGLRALAVTERGLTLLVDLQARLRCATDNRS